MCTEPSRLPSNRKRPIHQPVLSVGNGSVIVYLTVCVAGRQPVLANPESQDRLREAWLKASTWLVGRYVIMPDHLHLFCSPGVDPAESLTSWVAYWKRLVSFRIGHSFWQKNFWDTQLRRQDSYALKWDYVRNNPVRAGLVPRTQDWVYQGEMNALPWHD